MPLDKRPRTAGAALLHEPGRPETLEEWPDIAGASNSTLAWLFGSGMEMGFVDRWHQARFAYVLVRLARGLDIASVSRGLG